MAWGMSKEKNPIPALWKAFVLGIIDSNQSAEQNGWRWLCAISLLLDINQEEIRKKFPKEHPLEPIKTDADLSTPPSDKNSNPSFKAINKVFEKQALAYTIKRLKIELKNPKKIKKIDFSGLTFGKEFKEKIDFSNFIFPVDTDFSNTTFSKNVFFTNAVFSDTANFENAEFHGETANFRDATFKKEADFNKTIFKHYANFKGAKFGDRTIFQQAKFDFHAPRFYGAKFNNELILNRIDLPESTKDTLLKVRKTEAKKGDTKNDIYQKTIEENKSAYETLIFLMEKQNKHHDKQRFFREEMRWRQLGNKITRERLIADAPMKTRGCYLVWRKLKKRQFKKWQIENTLARKQRKNDSLKRKYSNYPKLKRIENNFTIAFFWLYDNVADYGNGIGRALAWWLAHILFGVIVIMAMVLVSFGVCAFYGYPPSLIELGKNLVCTIPVSFTNANPVAFIGIDKSSLMDCYDSLKKLNPLSFGIIRVCQTFLGIILLFLLLTTLRVRFRLGGATSNNKDQ